MPVLGRESRTAAFRDLADNPGDETVPGVAVVRLDGGLFFATAEAVSERLRELVDADPDVRLLVLDLEGADFIDSQGSAALGELADELEGGGIDLQLARVKPHVQELLRTDGILERLGENRVHATINGAIEAGAGDTLVV